MSPETNDDKVQVKSAKSKDTTKSKKANALQKKLNVREIMKAIKKRTIAIAFILIIALFITNPAIIPFLSFEMKARILNALQSLFGDVTQIFSIITLNWITIFQLIIMTLLLFVIMDFIRVITEKIQPKNNRWNTLLVLFQNSSQYLFTIIGIIWALKILGISPGTIFAGISIVALIVGFSAESLIADVITGLFLLFDNLYNVGDIIEVNDFRGTVKKIGIRTTSIEDAGNNIKIINNSEIRNIINRSSTLSKAVCDITIPANHDILAVEKCVDKILKGIKTKYPEMIINDPEYLGIQTLNQDSIIIRVIASVEEKNIYNAQRILNREVKLGLEQEGIWERV